MRGPDPPSPAAPSARLQWSRRREFVLPQFAQGLRPRQRISPRAGTGARPALRQKCAASQRSMGGRMNGLRNHRRRRAAPSRHHGDLQPCRARDLLDLVGNRDHARPAPHLDGGAPQGRLPRARRRRSRAPVRRARLWQLRRLPRLPRLRQRPWSTPSTSRPQPSAAASAAPF